MQNRPDALFKQIARDSKYRILIEALRFSWQKIKENQRKRTK